MKTVPDSAFHNTSIFAMSGNAGAVQNTQRQRSYSSTKQHSFETRDWNVYALYILRKQGRHFWVSRTASLTAVQQYKGVFTKQYKLMCYVKNMFIICCRGRCLTRIASKGSRFCSTKHCAVSVMVWTRYEEHTGKIGCMKWVLAENPKGQLVLRM